MAQQLTKDMIEAFLLHPDWVYMQRFIEDHFENSIDIQTIDTGKESTVVHAEVIARQQIDRSLKDLGRSFKTARDTYGKSKKSYE